MKRRALLFLIGAATLLSTQPRFANAAAATETVTAPSANEAEILVKRVFVPSPEQRVGEVRILRRGDVEVVQTLLYTKLLRRVVGEIRKKELVNWSTDSPGAADSIKYITALDDAQQRIWAKVPKFERGGDPRQRLLIEFVLGPDINRVEFAEYESSGDYDSIEVIHRQPLSTLAVDRAYVRRNMRLIIADSFGIDEKHLDEMLGTLPLLKDSPNP